MDICYLSLYLYQKHIQPAVNLRALPLQVPKTPFDLCQKSWFQLFAAFRLPFQSQIVAHVFHCHIKFYGRTQVNRDVIAWVGYQLQR